MSIRLLQPEAYKISSIWSGLIPSDDLFCLKGFKSFSLEQRLSINWFAGGRKWAVLHWREKITMPCGYVHASNRYPTIPIQNGIL